MNCLPVKPAPGTVAVYSWDRLFAGWRPAAPLRPRTRYQVEAAVRSGVPRPGNAQGPEQVSFSFVNRRPAICVPPSAAALLQECPPVGLGQHRQGRQADVRRPIVEDQSRWWRVDGQVAVARAAVARWSPAGLRPPAPGGVTMTAAPLPPGFWTGPTVRKGPGGTCGPRWGSSPTRRSTCWSWRCWW
jgi:hypothetical protein